MKLEAAEFLEASKQTPIIDVRSPAEFEKGHIPGAVNIPLFNNEERAEVGTIYKKSGRQAAVFRGLEIEGPKMTDQMKKALATARQGRVLLHCWRGGMRSESMAWLFKQGGLQTGILSGGYKAYRQYIRRYFSRDLPLVVLGGMTGSGKTGILHHLHECGEQVIDLEGIAHHKGSAFGDTGQLPQPTNEQFENNLAAEWLKMKPHRLLWLEDESRSIGNVILPAPVFSRISRAPVIFIELSRGERIKRLVKEYARFPKDILEDAIHRIRKRLGGKNEQEALNCLAGGDFERVAEIVLRYYDKAYMEGLQRRPRENVFPLKLEKDVPRDNAQGVLNFYKECVHKKRKNGIRIS